jgi:predicted metalloprotease with PDZ domain
MLNWRWNVCHLCIGLLPVLISSPSLGSYNPQRRIKIEVDVTDAPRKILHARLEIPVQPGSLTLCYPKWIPGDHAPDGAIVDLTGLKFFSAGKPLRWRRDSVNMYAFHLEVPPGAGVLEVLLDFLISPPRQGASSSGAATSQLAVLSWEEVLLYPDGWPASNLVYEPTLHLPTGWKFGTALPVEKQEGSTITFAPVSLGELMDSPVLTGAHFRVVPLSPEANPTHVIDMAADTDAALAMTPELIEHYSQLVAEAGALFGSRHYRNYHFLLSLSDDVAHLGLEHHESSDDRVAEQTLQAPDLFLTQANLLPHEFTHSWNGKYRRPTDLTTQDYQQPARGDLLWVYEGLTQYLGDVLTVRSGLWTQEQYREQLAYVAATLDHRAGRMWRPLQDTADSVQILSTVPNDQVLSSGPSDGAPWRRSTDYYDEGTLLWLEVDTMLRRLSADSRSIDDLCKHFLGGTGGLPEIKTYTFDNVVDALNDLASFNWRSFLRNRLDSTDSHAPLDGIENAGWHLVYTEAPNHIQDASERANKKLDLSFSIGVVLDEDGTIHDVIPGMAADKAGVGPEMKILGVNGQVWSPEAMRKAISSTRDSIQPLELLILYGKSYQLFRLDYHGGSRYPHLKIEPNRQDLLGDIISSRIAKH